MVIAIGKLKEDYLKEGVNEYIKRLSRYCKIDIKEIPDEKIPDNVSLREAEIIKRNEGEGIRKYLKEGMYKIALCIDGKMLSSEELSGTIDSLCLQGISNIMFIIGGSLGLSDEIVRVCDMKLSFSRMTFPHQLMRLILLEQIYRSFKIIHNETYHK